MSIQTIAVIGSGLTGRGIAYVSITGGFRTLLHDVAADALDRACPQVRLLCRSSSTASGERS